MGRRVTQALRYAYDKTLGRFFNRQTQELIPPEQQLPVMEGRIAASRAIATNAIEQARLGNITFIEAEEIMTAEIRYLNTQLYAFGRGGFNRLTEEDYQVISQTLKEEYGYMRPFIESVQSGNMTPAQVTARFRLYSNHAWQSFYNGERQGKIAAGFKQERRVLQPAEHCQDCINLAGKGWQPIGTLPVPGQGATACKANCKCIMEFQK